MTNAKFFDESKEQSQVKAAIITKYFWAWARVIIGAQKSRRPNVDKRIAHINLFAGPGLRSGWIYIPGWPAASRPLEEK